MGKDIRSDFPFLANNPETIYFDSAATSLKPQAVIDAVVNYYTHLGSNIHRGDYDHSFLTSDKFDEVRNKVGKFMNADPLSIVFTSGASESLNLVAYGIGITRLKAGDVILLNEAEHASNVLPWFNIAAKTGALVEFIPLNADGMITMDDVALAMHDRVKIVAMAHVSNVIGYLNDIKAIAKVVHQYQAVLCIDGAQAVGHTNVDVIDTDVDFYAFSAHKMMGPTGVGVLYGKKELLEEMEPLNYGGGSNTRFNLCGEVTLKDVPYRFESGTPNIEGVIGFGAALDYIEEITMGAIQKQETLLHERLVSGLEKMPHITIYNKNANTGIITFNVKGIFAQDVAAYLNLHHISVRSGSHCSKLISGVIKTESTIRLSLYVYNTIAEVDRFLEVIDQVTLEKTIELYV